MDINAMTDRFLGWPLPESVCADRSATRRGPNRSGSILLTATEARAMLEYVTEPLRARVAELESGLSRCLLGDPPGDCYAAEVVTLRAEVERLRGLLERIVDSFSEPTLDDARMDYVEVQMDRDAVAALSEARAAMKEPT